MRKNPAIIKGDKAKNQHVLRTANIETLGSNLTYGRRQVESIILYENQLPTASGAAAAAVSTVAPTATGAILNTIIPTQSMFPKQVKISGPFLEKTNAGRKSSLRVYGSALKRCHVEPRDRAMYVALTHENDCFLLGPLGFG